MTDPRISDRNLREADEIVMSLTQKKRLIGDISAIKELIAQALQARDDEAEKLVAALSFYAHDKNYYHLMEQTNVDGVNKYFKGESQIDSDKGQKAREAISSYEKVLR